MTEPRGDAALLLAQVRYQNRIFWRTPVAAFFTIVFPLMFLVLFNLLFSGDRIEIVGRGPLSVAQFFAPALGVFAAASATYTNLGIGTAIARDGGILKRFRGHPIVCTDLYGWPSGVGGVDRPAVGDADDRDRRSRLRRRDPGPNAPGCLLDLHSRRQRLRSTRPGIGCVRPPPATVLPPWPMRRSSRWRSSATCFIPIEDPPAWLETVGDIFPLKHFVRAFQDAFSPFTTDLGFRWGHLAVMAAWGVGGLVLALRFFTWEPRTGDRGGRRRRPPTPS